MPSRLLFLSFLILISLTSSISSRHLYHSFPLSSPLSSKPHSPSSRSARAPTISRSGSLAISKQNPNSSASSSSSPLTNLLAGGLAGSMSATILSPLEVVKTHLQTDSSASFGKVVSDVYKRGGARGFYVGLMPALVGIFPTRAIYFGCYETAKSKLSSLALVRKNPSLGVITSSVFGSIAANSLTNPIWLLKTRITVHPSNTYTSLVKQIYTQEGVKGFFRGTTASYWGTSETVLQFFFYERIKKRLGDNCANKGGTAKGMTRANYVVAAGMSKAIATLATYPHEVARTRIRASTLPTSMVQTLRSIYATEGMRGLYGGVGVHFCKVVPNSVVMMVAFEGIKEWSERRAKKGRN